MSKAYGSTAGTNEMQGSEQDPLLRHRQQRKSSTSTGNQKLSDAVKAFSRRSLMERQQQQNNSAMNVSQPVMKQIFYKEKKDPKPKPEKEEQQPHAEEQPILPLNKPQHQHQQHHKKRYTWLYILLHPHSRHPHSVLFKSIISAIILVDVLFFIAGTEVWADEYPQVFYVEEGIVSTIFLVEYLCRLYVAPQSRKYQGMSGYQARLKYAFTFTAMIDLFSALPFFVELPSGWDLPNLTWIRFFRLLRILKTKSYARSMETVWRVIYYNGEILYVAFNMCVFLVLITSVLMYYLRPHNQEDAEAFQSLSATMYLSAMMLTGQGGPDGYLPWYTKTVVLITGFFSVAMFAIPASMLTWGFEAEAERCAKKARMKYLNDMQNQDEEEDEADEINNDGYYNRPYADYISSSSEPSDGDTTDEEYLAIIAGGEGEGGDEGNNKTQDDVVKQLIRTFQTSDTDASGTLNMDEFIDLMTDPSSTSQQLTMVGMATSVGLLAQRVQKLEHELKDSHRKLDLIVNAVVKKKK